MTPTEIAEAPSLLSNAALAGHLNRLGFGMTGSLQRRQPGSRLTAPRNVPFLGAVHYFTDASIRGAELFHVARLGFRLLTESTRCFTAQRAGVT